MATYTQLIYHIVYSTKNREKVLTKENKRELFKYMWGFIENRKGHLYRLNGVEDHIHILVSLRPYTDVSDFVKELKTSTNTWIKERQLFPKFSAWQAGYGAFTVSAYEKERLIEYIKNQEEHHKKEAFEEEFKRLLEEHGIDYEEKYLF